MNPKALAGRIGGLRRATRLDAHERQRIARRGGLAAFGITPDLDPVQRRAAARLKAQELARKRWAKNGNADAANVGATGGGRDGRDRSLPTE
jgi:hypothetical protein